MPVFRILVFYLTFFFTILLSSWTYAVPVAPLVHSLSQHDGFEFEARQWGDERLRGWETVDGYSIVFDDDLRSWTYAVHGADGSLISSSRVVGRDSPLSDVPKSIRPIGQARLLSTLKLFSREMSAEAPQRIVPSTGTASIPVILINFNDTTTTFTAEDFNTLLFGTGNYSMKDYYEEVSYGAFSVSAGPGGTVGWYQASNTHANYGTNVGGDDAWPGDLVYEAVAAADAAGFNFAAYDQNNDCYVDVVAIVHQGSGEEASGNATDIWSHRWTLNGAKYWGRSHNGEYTTNATCTADPSQKVKVNDYIIQPETYLGGMQTMGVFAHEYGHALGLPDLYDTDGSSEGIGNWSLMAGGSWNEVSVSGDRPAHPDAWCKYKLGWVTPVQVTGTLTNEPITQSATAADVYKLLNGSPSTGGEYFLVENRQKAGFDIGLPGAGLLIWHIDEAKSTNTGECYPGGPSCVTNHYHVALVQADNLWHMEKGLNRGDTGDPYPGSTGNTSFTASSSPNSNLYNENPSGVSITGISASGATMTATMAISVACTYSISPSSQSFTASGGTGSVSVTTQSGCGWTAVSNASWTTITSGSSGTGSGTVNYSVASTTSARTGTMTIAGQTFTVSQEGGETALSNGVPQSGSVTGTSAQSNWVYYYAEFGSGATNLVIDLYNLSADADLYVRRGSKPTTSTYDCRSWNSGTTNEQCSSSTPSSGTWWIGVNNYATGTISYTVKAAWSGGGFIDVPTTHWAYNYIMAIYNNSITVGCSQTPLKYCPDDYVTRGQMAAFIIRAKYGETFSYTTTPYFTDVPSTHTFFKYVQKLRDDGITVVSGTYGVNEYVTRGQMAAFIIRAKFGESFSYTTTPYFSDVPSTHNFFKYVQKLRDEGITAVTGTYYVNNNVTRAEMAAFIARAFLGMQ